MQSTPPVRATLMLLPHRLQHAFFLVFMVTTIVKKTIVNSTTVSYHNLTWHLDRFWHDILTDFDMTLWQLLTSVAYLLIYPWHWFWWSLVLDDFTCVEELIIFIWPCHFKAGNKALIISVRSCFAYLLSLLTYIFMLLFY